jgi:hypothetical protein
MLPGILIGEDEVRFVPAEAKRGERFFVSNKTADCRQPCE